MSSFKVPWFESYLRRCALKAVSARSFIATTLKSDIFRSRYALSIFLPILPNPLIAIFMSGIVFKKLQK